MPSSRYDVNIFINAKDQTGRGADTAKDKMSGLAKAAKLAAAGYVALKVAQKAIEFVKFGAKVSRAATALDNLAKGAGTSGDAIIKSIQEASDFTIDRMSAMEAANKALLLEVVKTPEEFAALTKNAVLLGRAMGEDAATSVDKFTRAAGRQSKLIADDLGLKVDLVKVQEETNRLMAEDATLTEDAAKARGFFNVMMEEAERKTAVLNDEQLDLATQIEILTGSWKTLTQIVGEGTAELTTIGKVLGWVSDKMILVSQRTQDINEGLAKAKELGVAPRIYAEAYADAAAASRLFQGDEDELRKSLEKTTDAIDDQTSSVEDEAAALEAMHAAMIKQVDLQGTLLDAEAVDVARAALGGLGDLLKDDKIAVEDYALAVTGTQLAFGLADDASIRLAGGVELLVSRFADGTVTADEFDDQLLLLIEATDKSSVSSAEQAKILEENIATMEAAAAAAKTAATNQASLAASFKDTTAAKIAESAISELGSLLDEDKITVDQYKTAVTQTQLAFGLADEASIKLSESVLDLVAKFGEGAIRAENFDNMLLGLIERTALERDEVEKLSEELEGLPDSKTIDIFVNTHTSGGGGTGDTAVPADVATAWGLGGPVEGFQHGGLLSGAGIVGDRGPELVQGGPGTRVSNRMQTTNITNHFNQVVNTRARSPSVQADFRMMQARIGT